MSEAMDTDTAAGQAAAKASAKARVKLCLGAYIVIYLVVAGGYMTFLFTGAEAWTPEQYLTTAFGDTSELKTEADFLRAARARAEGEGAGKTSPAEIRLGKDVTFENEARERTTLRAGERLTAHEAAMLGHALAADIAAHHEAAHEDAVRGFKDISVYKEGFLTLRDWPYVMTFLNLAGFFLLVGLFLWGPITGWLAGSAGKTAETVARAKAAQSEAEAIKRRYEELVGELEDRQRKLDASLADDMTQERERIIGLAKRESEEMIKGVQAAMAMEVRHAAERIKADVVRDAVAAARAIIEKESGAAEHNGAVTAFLSDLKNIDLKK